MNDDDGLMAERARIGTQPVSKDRKGANIYE